MLSRRVTPSTVIIRELNAALQTRKLYQRLVQFHQWLQIRERTRICERLIYCVLYCRVICMYSCRLHHDHDHASDVVAEYIL